MNLKIYQNKYFISIHQTHHSQVCFFKSYLFKNMISVANNELD